MERLLVALGVARAAAHGAMYEPPTRNSAGMSLLSPTCPGGSCQWYNQGCTIGCKNMSGLHAPGEACDDPAEPTLKWGEDDEFLQYHEDGYGGNTTYHPWRYPGSAPIDDPCGITGGARLPLGQWDPPPGFKSGVHGSDLRVLPPLLDKTHWVAGSQVEVAWGIAANHGGGYQYRLCPVSKALTEECFQQMPLEFVGNKQWLQFGHGFDKSDRLEITAKRLSGKKVVPEGSTWTMNPIPGCKENGGRARSECMGPTFEPAPGDDKLWRYGGKSAKGIYGYGSGRCMGNLSKTPSAKCTEQEYYDVSFDFGIVDLVQIPKDLPEGDYVLSWRWDCEMTKQIWNSCADVTVKKEGKATPAFTKGRECSACCPHGMCYHCKKCMEDKTGDCAKCWEPYPWWDGLTFWTPRSKAIQCLGGARDYVPGDPLEPAWSPGCEDCWKNERGCEPMIRGVGELVVKKVPVDWIFYGVIGLSVVAGGLSLMLLVSACRPAPARQIETTSATEMTGRA
mmetsp:Transcript_36365/g.67687  ORF Transcript_36365/g.67687 Transcript_36365/m.67687 type:complete len:507 (+) Transcript_36365:60-1580(+)